MASRYSDDESDPSDIPDIDSTHTIQPYMYELVSNSGNNRTHAVSDVLSKVDNHVKPRQSTVNLPVFTDKR
jgi:hypothetical protein